MNYQQFSAILNRHIFEGDRKRLLRRIANSPERFIGLFRPTKPRAKILQYLLQSHEIRFGDSIEELIEEILGEMGYTVLPKDLTTETGERLSLDQYFADANRYYFIEQKVRDDHDSTKKRGQLSNFETKLEVLYNKHGHQLIGVMYFIDPDFSKNKNYYLPELRRLSAFYNVELHLLYGGELFDYLHRPDMWNKILTWLVQWKDSLPELPEINLDITPRESFEEVKALELRHWRKLLENETLWAEGIIKAVFGQGDTLRLLLSFFSGQRTSPYATLARLLRQRLDEHYGGH